MTTPETPTPRTDDYSFECSVTRQMSDGLALKKMVDFARQLERELTEALACLVRYRDLVRYQRAELHEAGLITDEEYTALLSDDKAVARLESYDQLQSRLTALERVAKDMAFAIEEIKTHFSNIEAGLVASKNTQIANTPNDEVLDVNYWNHELKAFSSYTRLLHKAIASYEALTKTTKRN